MVRGGRVGWVLIFVLIGETDGYEEGEVGSAWRVEV